MAKLLTAAESPRAWAAGGQAIEISEEISAFPRLGEAVGKELGRVEAAQQSANWQQAAVTGRVSFAFADAQSDDVVATVEARTVVPLVCQRCLETFSEPLQVAAKLLFVAGEEEAAGRPGYEAWELDEDVVRPLELADELLVMALPFAAMHDDANCSAGTTDDAPAREETVRPFADLRAQMEAASTPDEPAKD